MARRDRGLRFDSLEPRRLLSRGAGVALLALQPESKEAESALVGSIQGTSYSPATQPDVQLSGAGVVQPMGVVNLTGVMVPNPKTGAVNSHATLVLSNSQGSLTLALKDGKGFFLIPHTRFNKLPYSASVQSATGSYRAIRVQGTLNLVIAAINHPPGAPVLTSLSISFDLKPTH